MTRILMLTVSLGVGLIALAPNRAGACVKCFNGFPCGFCDGGFISGAAGCIEVACVCGESGTCGEEEEQALDGSTLGPNHVAEGEWLVTTSVRRDDGSVVMLDCGDRIVGRKLSATRTAEVRDLTFRIAI